MQRTGFKPTRLLRFYQHRAHLSSSLQDPTSPSLTHQTTTTTLSHSILSHVLFTCPSYYTFLNPLTSESCPSHLAPLPTPLSQHSSPFALSPYPFLFALFTFGLSHHPNSLCSAHLSFLTTAESSCCNHFTPLIMPLSPHLSLLSL